MSDYAKRHKLLGSITEESLHQIIFCLREIMSCTKEPEDDEDARHIHAAARVALLEMMHTYGESHYFCPECKKEKLVGEQVCVHDHDPNTNKFEGVSRNNFILEIRCAGLILTEAGEILPIKQGDNYVSPTATERGGNITQFRK